MSTRAERVEIPEGQFEEWRGLPEFREVPGQEARRWRRVIAIAAVLLVAILMALAASDFLPSTGEDAPMQVEPKVLMA